jgi:hypothetical protein
VLQALYRSMFLSPKQLCHNISASHRCITYTGAFGCAARCLYVGSSSVDWTGCRKSNSCGGRLRPSCTLCLSCVDIWRMRCRHHAAWACSGSLKVHMARWGLRSFGVWASIFQRACLSEPQGIFAIKPIAPLALRGGCFMCCAIQGQHRVSHAA